MRGQYSLPLLLGSIAIVLGIVILVVDDTKNAASYVGVVLLIGCGLVAVLGGLRSIRAAARRRA